MEQQTYRGNIDPEQLAQHLLETWDQGDTVAQALADDAGLMVQIGHRTGGFFNDKPKNALTLALEPIRDGLRVTLGEQQWYSDSGKIVVGGLIGFLPFFFTWPLGGNRDEPIDQQLASKVWESVEVYTSQYGVPQASRPQLAQQLAATGETTRLPGLRCPICGVENAPGTERCRECSTFIQAQNCPQCGVSNSATANFCMRCGSNLSISRIVNG